MDFATWLSFSVWFWRWLHKRGLPALFALEIPSANSRVANYRTAALCFFMSFAGLSLCGSLIRVLANPEIGDAVSWTGLGCLVIAAICVLRSSSINLKHRAAEWAMIGTCDLCGGRAVFHSSELDSATGEWGRHHLCLKHARFL